MITTIQASAATRVAGARPRRSDGGGRFQVPEPAGGMEAAETTATAAPTDLGGLLALQEEPGAEAKDRQARARGTAILAELAALQRTMLGDGDDGQVSTRLEHLVADPPSATDPALAAVLRQITLRARIEALRHRARRLPATGNGP